jgi:5-methylcytosine-specific restriction enzyme A
MCDAPEPARQMPLAGFVFEPAASCNAPLPLLSHDRWADESACPGSGKPERSTHLELHLAKASRLFRAPHQPAPQQVARFKQRADAIRRGTSASRGYGHKWQQARLGYLAKHPLCVCCLANERVTPARMVDHVVPHEGDMTVFWRSEDWQALCDDCNQRIKQPIELRFKAGQATAHELRLDRRMPALFPTFA